LKIFFKSTNFNFSEIFTNFLTSLISLIVFYFPDISPISSFIATLFLFFRINDFIKLHTIDKYAVLMTMNKSLVEIEIIVRQYFFTTFLHRHLQIVVAHHFNQCFLQAWNFQSRFYSLHHKPRINISADFLKKECNSR